jgi:uncharacterized membrane protein
MKKFLTFSLILLGIADAIYLTWEHFSHATPACPVNTFLGSYIDCGKVLSSSYATILGLPLALYGLVYFIFLLVILKTNYFKYMVIFGLLFSCYLLFIQIYVLHAICIYCTLSGLVNLILFLVTWSSKLFSTLKLKNSSPI